MRAILGVLVGLLLSFSARAGSVDVTDNPQLWMNVSAFGEAHWAAGEIHLISTDNWFLLSKKRYRDFELELEVKLPQPEEYVNSGAMFRGQIAYDPAIESYYAYGYQAEVDPSERRWSGGLCEQATEREWLFPRHPERSAPGEHFKANHSPQWTPAKAKAFNPGAWNHYKIRALGPEIIVWVNGVLTTAVTDTKFAEGHIGLQHHGSAAYASSGDTANTIQFRRIRITELPPPEPKNPKH